MMTMTSQYVSYCCHVYHNSPSCHDYWPSFWAVGMRAACWARACWNWV